MNHEKSQNNSDSIAWINKNRAFRYIVKLPLLLWKLNVPYHLGCKNTHCRKTCMLAVPDNVNLKYGVNLYDDLEILRKIFSEFSL